MRITYLLISLLLLVSNNLTAKYRFISQEKGKLTIIDKEGKVEWQMNLGGIHDIQMLPNGNCLTHQGTRIVEIDLKAKKIVWEFETKSICKEKRVEVHSTQRLANGNTMISISGEGVIVEIDKEGKVVNSVKMKRNHPNAHSDTRLVRVLKNGNYLVSHEIDGAVREYTKKGELVWEYDIPLFGKKKKGGHGLDAWGNKTFASIRLDNGNTLIATGNGHSVLEVTPAKEIVWHLKQDDLPGIKLAWVTTLEALPNGNIVIGNCHAGSENPQLIEVNKNKKVIWQFKDFKVFGNNMSNSQLLDVESIR
ncbi:MAG: PQQ-binding-like beta-propeller repeat protein [Lentisphaeraceae bacterium]|nr:PQQ-binding-like beta-propeller repeat protein [Lentisphaeraceae bacterium]